MASASSPPPSSTEKKPASPSQPIPQARLQEIANETCTFVFQFVDSYDHSRTSSWNTNIINTILQSLIKEGAQADSAPAYKFAVTSTIIQHTTPPKSYPVHAGQPGEDDRSGDGVIGRRGMHSATGAFWNNEKDGMWSFKFDGGEAKGFDVVISVVWISIQ